ncbi:hypothetical protein H072_6510 [Dactylellina haptotyla CBS 200.50]|uniref:Uncharacterized protein n=1 Tax=Dactylellina haptotyla (strain CBS 200.50) TaxID=1284197 RepID=S8A9M5_DACHA|nr:hypothetical protein H072_6510 [Dactylellina haptotyla CBS 200.50]
MKISSIAIALSFCATAFAAAINSPDELFKRTGSANGCNHNNCYRAVIGDGEKGIKFCKKFLWNRGYSWGDCGDYKEKCQYDRERLVTACKCILNDDHLPMCKPRGDSCDRGDYKWDCCRYDDNWPRSNDWDSNDWGHCGWKDNKCD